MAATLIIIISLVSSASAFKMMPLQSEYTVEAGQDISIHWKFEFTKQEKLESLHLEHATSNETIFNKIFNISHSNRNFTSDSPYFMIRINRTKQDVYFSFIILKIKRYYYLIPFNLNVIYGTTDGAKKKEERHFEVNIIQSPSFCGSSEIPSFIKQGSTVDLDICGKPTPTIQWSLDGLPIKSTHPLFKLPEVMSIENYSKNSSLYSRKTYSKTVYGLNTNYTNLCGRELSYNITGHGGYKKSLSKTTKVFMELNFHINNIFVVKSTFKDCYFIQWDLLPRDIGKCKNFGRNYTLKFFDVNQTLISTTNFMTNEITGNVFVQCKGIEDIAFVSLAFKNSSSKIKSVSTHILKSQGNTVLIILAVLLGVVTVLLVLSLLFCKKGLCVINSIKKVDEGKLIKDKLIDKDEDDNEGDSIDIKSKVSKFHTEHQNTQEQQQSQQQITQQNQQQTTKQQSTKQPLLPKHHKCQQQQPRHLDNTTNGLIEENHYEVVEVPKKRKEVLIEEGPIEEAVYEVNYPEICNV